MLQRKTRAFITGITGQDGSYLAELLLSKNYDVAGLLRSSSTGYLGNVHHLRDEIKFYRGSLEDARSIETAIIDFKPDEIYNLGAEASPFDSFQRRVYTSDVNALGALRLFEAAYRLSKTGHRVKVYQASASEMFGNAKPPQSLKTVMKPNNPYGVAKLFAHNQARIFRESQDPLFISCGILFNHESPRRGLQYVTRKITVGVACIKNKVKELPLNEIGEPIITKDWKLHLGNLSAKRDWGYAPDYVQAMWLILQNTVPGDYIVASGENHSIEEFVAEAFYHVGLDWHNYVVTDSNFIRPLETPDLRGDSSWIRDSLGWKPTVGFKELVGLMVDSDLASFS